MDLDKRFAQLYHIIDPEPREYYARQLIDGLYERGVCSNTPNPIPLPNWDDYADLENIIEALDMLKTDIQGMLKQMDIDDTIRLNSTL